MEELNPVLKRVARMLKPMHASVLDSSFALECFAEEASLTEVSAGLALIHKLSVLERHSFIVGAMSKRRVDLKPSFSGIRNASAQ